MSVPSLPTRRIGKDHVTAIGYGAMGIAAYYGSVESDDDRLKVRNWLCMDALRADGSDFHSSWTICMQVDATTGIPRTSMATQKNFWENGECSSYDRPLRIAMILEQVQENGKTQ